jgi:hypothetical protein
MILFEQEQQIKPIIVTEEREREKNLFIKFLGSRIIENRHNNRSVGQSNNRTPAKLSSGRRNHFFRHNQTRL